MLHLSRNIKFIRKVYGKTQPEFAAIMGVSVPMIKSYESGKAKPDELFMSRLESMTGISQSEICNRKLLEADLSPQKVEKVERPEVGQGEVIGLLRLMYEQMRTQNRILEGTTIKKIDTIEKNVDTNSGNIKEILAGVSSLVIQVQSAREVVLGSLERIENLKEGYLLGEVDRTVQRNMKGGGKQGKKAVIGR